MKSTVLWALAVLNVLLLAVFISRITRDNAAVAQVRPRGDYLLIAGDINAWTSQAVYVVDSTNSLLGALSYDDSTNRLDAMAPVSMAPAAANKPGAPPRTVMPAHKP